jgi:hypothetical protein
MATGNKRSHPTKALFPETVYADNRKCGITRRCGEFWYIALFVLAALFFFAGACVVVALYTSFYDAETAWQNVALLFSSIVFLVAAVYLGTRIGYYKENYQAILRDNYRITSKGETRGCCAYFVTGNALLVTAYLLVLGTAPLVAYPLPYLQYLLLIPLLLVLVLLLISTMPYCLALNGGRGSVEFDHGEHCEGGCCFSCCLTREQKRPCSSDFLYHLVWIAIFGIILTVVALVNVLTRFTYPGAWLFFLASLFATIGFCCLWEFSMPTASDEAMQDEAEAMVASLAKGAEADERTLLV